MTTMTLEGLPENITAKTTTYSRTNPLTERQRCCPLMEVTINLEGDSLVFIPCFSCSNFRSELDYYNYYQLCLTVFINKTFFRTQQNCSAHIARKIVRRILLPANYLDAYKTQTHRVVLQIQQQEVMNTVIREPLEEVAPQRRPCTIESVIEILKARAELDKAEKDWKEAEEGHECVICMDKIESVWDSLKPPCSHVFHDKCLLRWLDDNHACPLCRFELPFEEET